MRKNAFNAKERISAINKFRIAMSGKPFTKEQLLEVFKESHIPTNKSFWAEFRKSGIIKEIGKNQYVFASDQPVFYEDLGKVYQRYHSKTRRRKKPEAPVQEQQDDNLEEDAEEAFVALQAFAIDFLKELGYKIFAPAGTVYHEV